MKSAIKKNIRLKIKEHRKALKHAEEYDSWYQIAEELDVSVKTVEAHMSKALKSLRANLEDYIYILLVICGWMN